MVLLTELMNAPHYSSDLMRLPTPTYRLRPVSITGLAATEAGLPTDRATEAYNEGGGCSASPEPGSSPAL